MKNKLVGYAYEVCAYEVNIYKVLENNGVYDLKIISWQNFNNKEKIDSFVKFLEEQGYKSKESYVNNSGISRLIKKNKDKRG